MPFYTKILKVKKQFLMTLPGRSYVVSNVSEVNEDRRLIQKNDMIEGVSEIHVAIQIVLSIHILKSHNPRSSFEKQIENDSTWGKSQNNIVSDVYMMTS